MANHLSVASVFLLIHCCWSAVTRFDNYKLFEVVGQTKAQFQLMDELQQTSDSLIFLARVPKTLVIVAPHKEYDFVRILERERFNFKVLDDNVQETLEAEGSGKGKSSTFGWADYHNLVEINEWLNSLAKNHPRIVTVQRLGRSYEKRDILGVKLSHKPGNRAIFLEGGIHAREWISPAVVTYLIHQLLTSNCSDIQNIAQNYDWYIFPVTNPDGFVHTHEENRFWRKTRQPYGPCFGADPNRNFPMGWNTVGTSNYSCSDVYAGRKPLSEPETFGLASFVKRISDLRLYIAFHSYSQLLLLPYGHTNELPDNYDDLMEIAKDTMEALATRYGSQYTAGNVYDTIYPAAGSSMDWVHGKLGVQLAFTYELRPQSKWRYAGFDLPREEIVPAGEETLDSLLALVHSSRNLGYFD